MYQELFMDQQQEEPRDNPMGLASMVTGILSLLTGCCPFSGFFFGGLAVLFAALSKVELRLCGQGKIGLFTGLGGLILGSAALVWWLRLIF